MTRFLAAILLLLPSLARAHDFGAMLVSLTIERDHTIHALIRVDPSHLPITHAAALTDPATRVAARLALQSSLSSQSHLNSTQPILTPTDSPDDSTITWSFTAPAPDAPLTWRCDTPLGRYLLRITREGGTDSPSQWLDPGQTSDPSLDSQPPTTARIITDHLRLGFTHILPRGLDHILFILGLFLLSARVKPVLMQATAFTAAHSITLALAACNVVSPPSAIVEPLIAASIAYVGIENLLTRRSTARRTLIVFAFGLLHGLGFAGILRETGLPAGHLLPALISFNVGVELGQAAVILSAFLLVGLWFGRRPWYHARLAAPASLAIAGVAFVWTMQRLM